MARCGTCGVRLPLSGEPNCYCEQPATAGPVPEQTPMGTHGHPQVDEAEIDRSNGGER